MFVGWSVFLSPIPKRFLNREFVDSAFEEHVEEDQHYVHVVNPERVREVFLLRSILKKGKIILKGWMMMGMEMFWMTPQHHLSLIRDPTENSQGRGLGTVLKRIWYQVHLIRRIRPRNVSPFHLRRSQFFGGLWFGWCLLCLVWGFGFCVGLCLCLFVFPPRVRSFELCANSMQSWTTVGAVMARTAWHSFLSPKRSLSCFSKTVTYAAISNSRVKNNNSSQLSEWSLPC